MLLRGFFQNGYVVADFERAVDALRQLHGVDDITILEPRLEAQTAEGFGLVHVKVALAWVGGVQIELIEPVAGYVQHYRDSLPEDGRLMCHHHIGLRVESLDAARADATREQARIVYDGSFGGIEFLYVDARATLGHYVEYLAATPEGWRLLGWPEHRPA